MHGQNHIKFVQNSTLRARETSRNFRLKCRGLWFSPVFGVRYIPLQCPAIVCQHTWGPLALLLLFHSHNVLMNSFSVFVTDFAEIFWEKIQVWLQKVDFQTHIASLSFVRCHQVLHNIITVCCFVISWEVPANPLKWQPCISFILIQVFIELFVLHQLPDLGSYKYNLLEFCVTHIWELIPHIFESTTCFIYTIHKVFHDAQLYVQRGQINFLRKNRRRTDDIFLLCVSDRLGHSLLHTDFSFPAVPFV